MKLATKPKHMSLAEFNHLGGQRRFGSFKKKHFKRAYLKLFAANNVCHAQMSVRGKVWVARMRDPIRLAEHFAKIDYANYRRGNCQMPKIKFLDHTRFV